MIRLNASKGQNAAQNQVPGTSEDGASGTNKL